MDILSVIMPKNDQFEFNNNALSPFDNEGFNFGTNNSYNMEREKLYTSQNFADALYLGSQGLDFNYTDYKPTTGDFKQDQFNTNDFFPDSPQSFSGFSYQEDVSCQSWQNSGNTSPLHHYPYDTNFQQNFFQQQQVAYMTMMQKESSVQDVFQMDQSMKNKDIHQQVLSDLMKQKENYAPQRANSVSSSNPPSPASSYAGSSVPSPQPSLDPITDAQFPNIEQDDNLNSMDEEMLFNTFKTLAEFVSNENIKPSPVITAKNKVSKPKRKRVRKSANPGSQKPRLYNFLREILDDPVNYSCIEWVDKSKGLFKFLESAEVARLWGYRKNKPMMKYENFARSLRTYIAKGILTKPRNKLVYCFAKPLTTTSE